MSVVGTGTAVAQAGDDFAVFPAAADPTERPFFAYELRPGDVVEDVVRIVNFATEPRTFRTFAADGYNTSDVGSFALRQENEVNVDVGAWVRLGVDRWTIPGEAQIDIPFRLEVPSDATPGDHVGGIVALLLPTEPAEDAEGTQGFGLSVRRGIGARIYLRVAGPLQPALAIDAIESTHSSPISPFGSGSATITFRVANTGNVRMSPAVTFRARGPLGEIERVDLGEFADLLPGNSVVVTHEWSGVPAGGKITQSVTLTEGDLSYTRTVSFWVAPWWAVVVILIGGAGVFVLLRRRRRARSGAATVARSARAASTAVLALVAVQLIHLPGAQAADAEVLIRPDSPVEPGDRITVSGRGWPSLSNLVIEICGNEARRGTLDCAITAGRTAATSPDGRFAVELGVVEPPVPCPCVLRVWTVTGKSTIVAMPLSLGPRPEEVTSPSEPDADDPNEGSAVSASNEPLLRVEARLEGHDSWTTWFGGEARRTLVLSIENTGATAIADPVASLAWGSGRDPTGYVPLVPIGRLEVGETLEQRVDLRFDALSMGRITVRGEVLDAGRPVAFEATTATYPWALILAIVAVIVAAAVLALVALVRAGRRARGPAGRLDLSTGAVSPEAELESSLATGDTGPEAENDDVIELATVISEELAAVFDRALASRPVGEFDDPTFVRLVVELSSLTADRVAGRVSLSPEEREGLDDEIADAMLASFGFVPVENP